MWVTVLHQVVSKVTVINKGGHLEKVSSEFNFTIARELTIWISGGGTF